MSLQALALGAFSAIKTAIPEAVVAVVSGEETANGIKDTVRTDSNLLDDGERGTTTGTVRVDVSELTEPERGATITVGGESVFVMQTRIDSAGAILTIEYSKQRPMT